MTPQKMQLPKIYNNILSSPFRVVYENIYTFCHAENDPVTFRLDEEGNKVDRIAATLNKQWEENRCNEDLSKDDRHVQRLAAVMHVLYDQLEKRLNRRPDSPPPPVTEAATLKRAMRLTNYFTEQRQVLDQVRYQQ